MKRLYKNFLSPTIICLIFSIFVVNISSASLKKAQKYYSSDYANKNELIILELVKSKKYYSAVPFLIKRLEKKMPLSPALKKLTRIIVQKTGTYDFFSLSDEILKYHNTQTTNLILGLKLEGSGNYAGAIIELKKIKETHYYYPEANMTLGTLYNQLELFTESMQANQICQLSALKKEKASNHHKIKRYYSVLKESCLIHIARIKYKLGKYHASIKAHERVTKTSYKWPYILLEKAWTNYQLENYNRALGLLVTYKSPLLSSYFFPESEVLTALSYFKMCLWKDSLKVIDQYYNVYKHKSQDLKALLEEKDSENDKYINLILNPKGETPYIKNLSTQIRKKVKFSVQLAHYKKEKDEYLFFKSARKKTPFTANLVKYLAASVKNKKTKINFFAKQTMTEFINKIHYFSYEMFNIKLEIMANKRDLIYKNKRLVADRSRGDIDNLSKKNNQHFWSYKGAFWADELGDYSFGLKSNCKKVDSRIAYKDKR